MKKIVVFTGAGVSADSGIPTFRSSDGLWNNVNVEDVCTPQALSRNRDFVIDFYNTLRKDILSKQPNAAHYALASLARYYDVQVITQNVDDLHERAGSRGVLHLHGEIRKLCSSLNPALTVALDGWEQNKDARHADGSYLRPFIVFFGEAVPNFPQACQIAQTADIVIVVGTSFNVYPAASLLEYVPEKAKIYVVDPGEPNFGEYVNRVKWIKKRAVDGVPELCNLLINKK